MSKPSIPFHLVTGFLGSGKTTLLQHLLETDLHEKRVAVIQNEFAPANVDAVALRAAGTWHVTEMNGGSVFCVCLLSSFQGLLSDLLSRLKPEMVILEASGLSDPVAIGLLLQDERLTGRIHLAATWAVIDASRFVEMIDVFPRIRQQIRIADEVIVNKIEACRPESLTEVAMKIAEINPFATMHRTSFCRLVPGVFGCRPLEPVAMRNAYDLAHEADCERPAVSSALVKTTRRISRTSLAAFLHQFGPEAYRLKGYVWLDDGTVLAVQSCFGDVEMRPYDRYEGPTVLVALGAALDPVSFGRSFRRLTEE